MANCRPTDRPTDWICFYCCRILCRALSTSNTLFKTDLNDDDVIAAAARNSQLATRLQDIFTFLLFYYVIAKNHFKFTFSMSYVDAWTISFHILVCIISVQSKSFKFDKNEFKPPLLLNLNWRVFDSRTSVLPIYVFKVNKHEKTNENLLLFEENGIYFVYA